MPFRILPPSFRSHRGSLFVLIILLAGTLRADETTVAGTMPEDYLPGLRSILDTALKQSPSMIASELLIAQADAQRKIVGVAPMLPNIFVGPGYGKSVETVSGSSEVSGDKGLIYTGNISQPIFQWGALKNQLDTEKASELISEKNYSEGYRNFVTSLRRQYMALIVEKIDLRNAQYGLELSKNTLALDRDKLQRGTISSVDIIDPQLDADQKQLAVDRAEEGYAFARRTLAHEVGMNDLADETIPMEIPKPRYSADTSASVLAGLLRNGGRDTYLAQIQELQIRQADLSYKTARVRLLPKFYATAGVSQANDTTATATTVQQTLVTNKSIYLNASWTLFDGLATHWAKVQALEGKRYYERQLEMVTDSTIDEAENSRHTVDFAWRALGIAERQWEIASSALNHVQSELTLGTVSRDDVSAATKGLYLNESAINAARADFLASWSEFVSLVGADPAMNKLPFHYVHDIR